MPQGTVLGPVLFIVFINDLPSVLKSFCSIFADDTTAYTIGKDVASTCSNLSKDLDAASGWARTWGMLFYPEKSKHLAIKATDSTVRMDGVCLPKITTHTHLGGAVNEKLSWDDHVSKLYTDCARRIGILRRLTNKLNSAAFRKIFICAIRPKIEYACAVWSGGSNEKIHGQQCNVTYRRPGQDLPGSNPVVSHFFTLIILYRKAQNYSSCFLFSKTNGV